MTRSLRTIRKARKQHRCSRCDGLIQPGDLYVDARLPPGDNDIGNTTWWRDTSHVGAYVN